MTDLRVREAQHGDCAALSRLIVSLGYRASPSEIADRLPVMAQQGDPVLVAQLGDAVVGCLTTSTMQTVHRPAKVGRISMMVVEEGLRGAGIGRTLVRAAEERLHEAGCYIVEVTSRFELERAHGFYEALGYAKTSVRLARDL